MSDDGERPFPRGVRRGPPRLTLRLRGKVRETVDRVLAADLAWSAAYVVLTLALLLGGPRLPWSEGRPGPATARLPVDEAKTADLREAARLAVPEVWVHDASRSGRATGELRRVIDAARSAGIGPGENESGAVAEGISALAARGFPEPVDRALVEAVATAMAGLVVGNETLLEAAGPVTVLHLPEGSETLIRARDARVVSLEEARSRARETVRRTIPGEDSDALARFAAAFVDTNLFFDAPRTTQRREAAAAAVAPVFLEPDAQGLPGEAEAVEIEPARSLVGAAGMAVVVTLLAFFLFRYTRYHQRHYRKVRNLNALLVLMQVLMLGLTQGMLWVVERIVGRLSAPFSMIDPYAYVIPVGAGALMVGLLANGRIAMVYSGFVAVLFGAATGWDLYRMLWALLVQWAAVYAVSTYGERAALLRAGLVVGGAGTAAALALEAVRGRTGIMLTADLWGATLAFLGGAVGVGLLVSFALPLFEGVFKILTDVRLLELSNANHPLIAELALRAPGSYNHSLVLGTLAEEAAKAIGANALFCRVAAFYHDVGKIRKAEYYVENQRAENPHNRLSPSMSALIIAAHVKDGIRIAREAGLPEQIVDIVPQHHGTRLMSYFYDKALKQADPHRTKINEEDFRYPGPRPQSREAAIFMLADGVEAAARTLDDPTPSRLREVIHKIANAIVLDGQLDECDLTFADLERIEAALLRTLVGMHHHRVDYPGFEFGRPKSARGG